MGTHSASEISAAGRVRAPGGASGYSVALTAAALVSVAALSLPLAYLLARAAGIGPVDLWQTVSSARSLDVLFRSVAMGAAVAVCSLLVALPLAFVTVRTDLPWRRLWAVAGVLPLAVPSYVGSFALIAAFAPRGSFLQRLLEPFGVQELPSIYGMPGTVLAITLFTYPYLLLTLQAGLRGVDPATEEAARSLGLSRRTAFLRVLLPQLRPSLVAGLLLVLLYALRDFGTPSLMRFDSFTRVIYLQYTLSFDRALAAATALMLAAVVMLILWGEYRARTRAAYYGRGSGRGPAPPVRLGRWKWPALTFCTLVAGFSLVLPVSVSLLWLVRGIGGGLAEGIATSTARAALNSALTSSLAALITTLFALPVAILAVRSPGRLTKLVERCSYVALGLPGIVTALSLVFFTARYAPWLHHSLPLLVLAYYVIFFPQALGPVRSSLLQLNPTLEESSRSLGKTPWQSLRLVTLPLMAPGLTAGALLVFLATMKELPAALLLAPTGFDTLATRIWRMTEDVYFAEAAAGSLTMIAVCALLLLLAARRGERDLVPGPAADRRRNANGVQQ